MMKIIFTNDCCYLLTLPFAGYWGMITTADKSMFRKKMLEACMTKQQTLIDDFKSRIKALLQNEGLGNEEEYDNNKLSQNAQAAEDVNSINEELNLANEEMNVLLNLKSMKGVRTHVEPGAVVITNITTFFISVSIEQFSLDGENYVGLSTKSPLYQTMKGLTKGDAFHYNGISYKIDDIF